MDDPETKPQPEEELLEKLAKHTIVPIYKAIGLPGSNFINICFGSL